MTSYSKVKCDNLSGGNKRKIVCAMSLLACPQVEFLDEPTTGVDPVSRRSLFKMLRKLPSCSLILTTHRMDEAEGLCDKIAIMINGRFVVYGTPSYLKSTYGSGYQIKMKFHSERLMELNQYVVPNMKYLTFRHSTFTDETTTYQDAKIQENTYEVTNGANVPLSKIFSDLSSIKFGET